MGSEWLLGAVVAAIGSIASNLGVNCQKYSFMQNAKLPKSQQKKHIRQKGWLLGMALVVLGSIGDFAALSLAAQSIVAPIGSVTLVANVFFAHYWLRESLSYIEIVGTALIVGGSVTAVAFGDHTETAYDIHAILRFFYGTTFIVYAICSIVLGVVLYRFQLPITPIKQKIVDATKRYEQAYEANDRPQMEYEDFYIASLQKTYRKWEKVHPFSLCALSGILGGQSVMFGKMVSEMLNVTFAGDNQLFSPFFYLFVGCMLACVVGQLQYLAISLSFFDALYVVPVFQCFFISFSTLGGACFFAEFNNFNALQGVFFPLGLIGTLSGVIVLTRRKMGGEDSKRLAMAAAAAAEAGEGMEVIDEGDEEAAGLEEEEAEERRERNEVEAMERRTRRKERQRRRMMKQKQGYEGLEDEDDGEEEDEWSETEEDELEEEEELTVEGDKEEEEDEEMEEKRRRRRQMLRDHITRKPSEESKLLDSTLPTSSPPRHSPIRRTSGHSPLTTSTSSRSPSHPPSPTRPTSGITPIPSIDDLMAPVAAVAGTSPVLSGERRASMVGTPGSGERRLSGDRRHSMPRRASRQSPGPLTLFIDDGTTSSAPSTPSSLTHQPAMFRLGSTSPAAPQFMQPDLSLYMPPPVPNDLMKKEVPLNEKVKKYSSLAHHAGGLVAVPLVSAIAHAYVIAREEREEEARERKEKKEEELKEAGEAAAAAATAGDDNTNTSLTSSSSSTRDDDGIEMEPMAGHAHDTHEVVLPVAEPVEHPAADSTSDSSGAAAHHGHHPSIMDRLRSTIMHAVHRDKGEKVERDSALEEMRAEAGTREEEVAQHQPLVKASVEESTGSGSVLRLAEGEEAGVADGDSKDESTTRLSSAEDVNLLTANEEEQLRELEEDEDGGGI